MADAQEWEEGSWEEADAGEAPPEDAPAADGESWDEVPDEGGDWSDLEHQEEEEYLPHSNHAEHLELFSGTRVKPTPRFWIVVFTPLPLLLCGAVLGFLAEEWVWGGIAAGLAVVLGIYAVLSNVLIRSALNKAYITAERELHNEEELTQGDRFDVTLSLVGSEFPWPLRVWSREMPAGGLNPMKPIRIEGADEVRFEVRAAQSGKQRFSGIEMFMQDRRRLWVQQREYLMETPVKIALGYHGLSLRAQIMGQMAFRDDMPKSIVHMFRDISHEKVKEYGPGDRMKDVDWKRAAITGEWIVREDISEKIESGMLYFDCGTSMQMSHEGTRSLDVALDMAREIITNAVTRNLNIGFFAFNDTMGLAFQKPGRHATLPDESSEAFRDLSDPNFERRPPKDPMQEMFRKQDLMSAVAEVQKRSLATGGGITMFTDLDSIDGNVIQNLTKLAGPVKVGVILLPHPTLAQKRRLRKSGWKPPRTPPPGEKFFRGKKQRREMREVLAGGDTEFLDLRHVLDDQDSQEVKKEDKYIPPAIKYQMENQ